MRRHTGQNLDDLFERHNPLRGNTVTPNVYFTPMWLRDENQSSVEIIELNSSNEVETSPKVKKDDIDDNRNRNINNAWSYANNQESNESYKINEKARDRRRKQNANNDNTTSSYMSTEHNDNYNNGIPNNFYTSQLNDHMDEELFLNHQINCFTILNKHLMNADLSTDEEYDEVEIITSDDLIMDSGSWDPHNIFNEEIITCDTNVDQNARTIWIYSYKNKQLLTSDFDERDIASKFSDSNTSSSNTTDSSGEQCRKSLREKKETFRRIASPIPPTYVPRLDLSLVPTLSTVSEGSEQKTLTSSGESTKSKYVKKKVSNNWFISESAKVEGVRSVRKLEKSTNIINWMGLSPREKRRVLKDKSCSDTWVGTRLNLTDENNADNNLDQTYTTYIKRDTVNILVDAEVHADVNKNNENTTAAQLKNDVFKIDEASTINKIDAACKFQKDRGDHSANQGVASVHASPIIPKDSDVTRSINPSRKSESFNLVNENEKETGVYDYIKQQPDQSVVDKTQLDNSVDHWWMKNTAPFLKPTQWAEFRPIAESPVSYYLSLGSIVEDRQTWYMRLINFLPCCK